ncbi:DUF397 domain-containing protein [Streptomyces sp. NPDC056749]|uniref:DUF397 domain-containing protein n=1 Tax=Streptomyces sp. NPDC056749 TaxID=3345936 RepID=UPI00369BCBD6
MREPNSSPVAYVEGNEVADGFPGLVPVRDSKVPDGPCLVIAAPAWTAFVAHAAHPTASSVG